MTAQEAQVWADAFRTLPGSAATAVLPYQFGDHAPHFAVDVTSTLGARTFIYSTEAALRVAAAAQARPLAPGAPCV